MVSLRPYQEQAADFLYANDRAMVLAPVGAQLPPRPPADEAPAGRGAKGGRK